MKRNIFLLITSILATLFASMMLFSPSMAAENFGFVSTPENSVLFRSLGTAILGIALLNFLLRNETGNNALRAVFLVNILVHAISISTDVYVWTNNIMTLGKLAPSFAVHLFVVIGSIIYLFKLERLVK